MGAVAATQTDREIALRAMRVRKGEYGTNGI
jgi:hypothetical protein